MKQQIEERLTENIGRVKNLVDIYESHLQDTGSGRRGHLKTDVLRAATVFLHAAVEDFLRGLAYWKLPQADAATLNNVALVGHEGRPQKFYLGELAAHRGKSVDELITASVDEHLERSNYNNTDEVSAFLTSIGVDVSQVNARFDDIAALMARRHQIVHRADRDEAGGQGHHKVRSIGLKTLNNWVSAVEEFTAAVLMQVQA